VLGHNSKASTQSKDEMESGLFLNVVVSEGSSVLKLFSGKNESLLVWGNSFLVLDLGLNILDGVGALDLKGDGLSGQGFHEDLHTSTQSKDEMESGLLLNVVVSEGSSVLKLFSGKDESLLVWGNSFLVLDLGLDVLDGVGALDLQGDGLSSQSLDEDLHASTQSKDEMESGLFLDVVVSEGSSVLELFSGEDESLLVWGNSFLVLDLGLDILNGIRTLDLQSDGLSGQSLDEDLHASSKTKDEMEG